MPDISSSRTSLFALAGTGIYFLIVRIDPSARIPVGKLGKITFKRGYYIYVGSAMGPGGLKARVERHLRRKKKLHWHIDHLLEVGAVRKVLLLQTSDNIECRAAAHLMCELEVIKGFGSSDCSCMSHLFHSPMLKGAVSSVRSFSSKVEEVQEWHATFP